MIAPMEFWVSILFISIGTLLIRSSFIFLSSKIVISKKTTLIFSYIPAAVLPAIILPMVFFHKGSVEILYGKERLAVLILATIVSYYSKNMLLTVGFGLTTLYILKLGF